MPSTLTRRKFARLSSARDRSDERNFSRRHRRGTGANRSALAHEFQITRACRVPLPEESSHGCPRREIGVMSGTSADGIDVALVRIEARSPTSFKLLGHAEYPYPKKVRTAVLGARSE